VIVGVAGGGGKPAGSRYGDRAESKPMAAATEWNGIDSKLFSLLLVSQSDLKHAKNI